MFQNPNYKRHDTFGFMYRLPEVAAAMALGQLEKIDWFVEKRIKMGNLYSKIIDDNKCDWLKPQLVPNNDINSYYTYGLRLINKNIKWESFRKKYMEYKGDGIFAAWTLCYMEDSIPEIINRLEEMGLKGRFNVKNGICPTAEKIQRDIMQLTTNQKNKEERMIQAEALDKTIKYFS